MLAQCRLMALFGPQYAGAWIPNRLLIYFLGFDSQMERERE
jgi:hypothetical protein